MQPKKNLVNSMVEARHDCNDNKASRLLKHLVLEFPTGHILSSKEIFEKATKDEKLHMEIIPIAEDHKSMPKLHDTRHCACWRVARVDLKASKRGKIEHVQEVSEAAALLAALMGNDSAAGGDNQGMDFHADLNS
jgi:hypothetical protein